MTSSAQIVLKNERRALTADNIASQNGFGTINLHFDSAFRSPHRRRGQRQLVAGPGANVLSGYDGNDTSFGNSGPDTHFRRRGDDLLVDQAGATAWTCGDGNDTLWAGTARTP